jgi:hypothetical protein
MAPGGVPFKENFELAPGEVRSDPRRDACGSGVRAG